MTVTIATNTFRDIYIAPTGSLAMTSGQAAVMQVCASAARVLLGEVVYAIDQGIPFFDTAWAGIPNRPQFEAYLRRTLLAVDGVIEILSLTTTQTGDTLGYTATIHTVYGTGVISV